jgi:hypothetical protein
MTEPWHKGEWWTAFDYVCDSADFHCIKDGIHVQIVLNGRERKRALEALETGIKIVIGKNATMVFFDDDAPYDEANLILYRDDFFNVSLPHAAGLELLDVLRQCSAMTP